MMHNYVAGICVFSLLITVLSCGASTKKLTKKHYGQPVSMKNDTIPKPNMPAPQNPGPAPGTLRLKGKVIKVSSIKADSSWIYHIKVLEILGIGAGTPAVNSGAKLSVVSFTHFNHLKKDAPVICTIRHRQLLFSGSQDSTASHWQMIHLTLIHTQP